MPGVHAIITGEDVKGHLVGKQIRDMPVLCWDKVRFAGDRVAAVAAETVDAAEDALHLIDVDYEILPAVFDPLEAMTASAPLLHDNVGAYDGAPEKILAADLHNGLTRLAWRKGEVEKGFREADLVSGAYFPHSRTPSGLSRTARRDRGDRTRRPHSSLVLGEKPLRRAQPVVEVSRDCRRAHPHEPC